MAKAHIISDSRTADVLIGEDVRFGDMFLNERVLEGLLAAGFVKPSPIQLKAIPLGRCGIDLVVQAKSGTGKTCVFTVIALEMLDTTNPHLQVLILAPTREIAYQIQQAVQAIGQKFESLKDGVFMGGTPLKEDIALAKKCQIAIGSPGRVKHLIQEGHLDVQAVRLFVLDEADRLLEDSFRKDISYIHSRLPEHKQVIGTSATYPPNLEQFLTSHLQVNARRVQPESSAGLLLGLKQFVDVISFHTNPLVQIRLKTGRLLHILGSISFKQCLVFCNYQSRLAGICKDLGKEGWPAVVMQGCMPQKERLKTLRSLQEFKTRILLTTDLTARGIDAEHVNLIVNLDLPYDVSTYLHRVGRAGRFGSQGTVITIVHAGIEVERFQKIVWAIGGEGYSMPKLPQVIKGDTWETAVNQNFEHLTGKIGDYKEPVDSQPETKSPLSIIENHLKSPEKHSIMTTYEQLSHDFETFKITGELPQGEDFENNKTDYREVSKALISMTKRRPVVIETSDEDVEKSEILCNYEDFGFDKWKAKVDLRRRWTQMMLYQKEMLS